MADIHHITSLFFIGTTSLYMTVTWAKDTK